MKGNGSVRVVGSGYPGTGMLLRTSSIMSLRGNDLTHSGVERTGVSVELSGKAEAKKQKASGANEKENVNQESVRFWKIQCGE